MEEDVVQHNEFGFPRTEQFETKRPLKPEEVHDPTELVLDWVKAHDRKGIICFGEDGHHGGGTLEYESKLVEHLAEQVGVERVFLEEDRDQQLNVEDFYETGIMPEELKEYLQAGFVRVDSKPHTLKLELVQKCKELDIPVTFIGSDADDEKWSQIITGEVGESAEGTYLLIAGSNHVHHNLTNSAYDPKSKPTGYRLLEKYGSQQVLSLLVSTFGDTLSNWRDSVVVKYFERDLKKLGKEDTKCAVRVQGSPYEEVLTGSRVQLITKNAFDILVSVPGEDFFKHSFK